MQLSKLLLFVPLVLAVASPDAGADDVTAVAQVEARSGAAPALFAKRACNANGCRCSTKHKLKQVSNMSISSKGGLKRRPWYTDQFHFETFAGSILRQLRVVQR